MSTDPSVPIHGIRGIVAPQFGLAVADALNNAWRAGYDPIVFESARSDERQRYLFSIGRNGAGKIIGETVTNVPSALYGWHFFGCAVDVISRAHEWDDPEWFEKIAPFFKDAGCKWGGDWSKPDLPHFQWWKCKPSPSSLSRQLYKQGGLPAVWLAVGAA